MSGCPEHHAAELATPMDRPARQHTITHTVWTGRQMSAWMPVSRASPGFLLGAARGPSNTTATPSEPSADASAAAPATWRDCWFMTQHRATLTKSLPALFTSPASEPSGSRQTFVVMSGNATRAATAKTTTANKRTEITNDGARPQGSKSSTTSNCAECCRRMQWASSRRPTTSEPTFRRQENAYGNNQLFAQAQLAGCQLYRIGSHLM